MPKWIFTKYKRIISCIFLIFVFHGSCIILHSYQLGRKVPIISPYIFCVVAAVGHVSKMVSHCPFEVHFLSFQKCWVVLSDTGWCQVLSNYEWLWMILGGDAGWYWLMVRSLSCPCCSPLHLFGINVFQASCLFLTRVFYCWAVDIFVCSRH